MLSNILLLYLSSLVGLFFRRKAGEKATFRAHGISQLSLRTLVDTATLESKRQLWVE